MADGQRCGMAKGDAKLSQLDDVEGADHAAFFRVVSSSSRSAWPAFANAIQWSAGMLLRWIQERTVLTETLSQEATCSGDPARFTMSE